ncbi:MAG: branched-chain amino acid ABC transporter permease [Spirochaetales bacterium]|uniref:Branched-chain amino acid ABC transporter permease n=1 Tax=Candidatus Thalassospirochaeta sargassi TaxID=3119039 RepID=A0AAJ1IE81_9SPIO|nr:branched-chain amino acid ABC transporter permease [Spirochaetales bacterium]
MNKKLLSILGPVIIVALMIVFRYLFPNKITFLTEVGIFSIYVMGNNILMGYLGYTSFGQPFYLSVGAYSAAIFFAYFGGNIFLAIIVAIVVGLLLSLVLAPGLMRLKSSYFTLINAALCMIGVFIFERLLIDVTNGNDGLWFRGNMAATPLLDVRYPKNFFFFVLLILLIAFYLYQKMDKSAFGISMKATKANPEKMTFLGYNVFKIRSIGYAISIMMSTLAGSLYAINFGFVNPNLGENTRAIEVLLATLIGGVGSVFGPFFGALGFLGMKDIVSTFMTRWEFVVGVLTIIVLFKFNRGIWGLIEDGAGLVQRGRNKKTVKVGE